MKTNSTNPTPTEIPTPPPAPQRTSVSGPVPCMFLTQIIKRLQREAQEDVDRKRQQELAAQFELSRSD